MTEGGRKRLRNLLTVAVDRSGILPHAAGGGAKWVLGDGDDGGVRVYGEGLGTHVWDCGAHYEGGLENSPEYALEGHHADHALEMETVGGALPHGHVQDVFRIGHSTVAHFKVVKIVPCARLGFTDDRCIFVEYIHHRAVETRKGAIVGGARAAIIWTVEGIVDVATHAPAVGNGTGPIPWVIFTPIAERV